MKQVADRCVLSIKAHILAEPRNEWTLADRYSTDDIFDALPQDWDASLYSVPPAPADRLLAEGNIIDLGDRAWEVIHTPGHSPGGFALYERKTVIFLSGDIIYDGPLIDDSYHSLIPDYVATLECVRGSMSPLSMTGTFRVLVLFDIGSNKGVYT
jgi:glyoxylase-like metal-dependent hydrolase (beta-lactamase superfamily II)